MNAKFKNSSLQSTLLVVALSAALVGCGGAGAPTTNVIETKIAQSYTVEIVEAPNGTNFIDFRYVSPNGTVGGEYYDNDDHRISFSYKNGVLKKQTPVNGDYSISGVSDNGTIEGEYFNGTEDMPYSTAGGFHEIKPPLSYVSGWNAGRDANGNGYITITDANNVDLSYREANGVFTPLTVENAASLSLSRASSAGYAVGSSYGGSADGFYLFSPNTTTGVKVLEFSEAKSIQAVNNLGTVGGYLTDAGMNLAFVKMNGQFHTLPNMGATYCATNGINDGNIAVGYMADTPNGTYKAFGWTETDGTVDLNTRIPATPGLALQIAHGVDSMGRIIGRGNLNGKTIGFILTPVK